MDSKPGYVSLNGEPAPQVIKHGWPDTTPRDEAIRDTIAYVHENFPGQEIIGEPEIIQNEEHKEAGEYLVKVLAL